MRADQPSLRRDLAAAWRTAGEDLGFEVVAPFRDPEDATIEASAFVRWFGSPSGALVLGGVGASVDPTLLRAIELRGYWVSILAMPDYCTYERALYVDTLSDWGFFGPESDRPSWLVSHWGA